MPTIMPRQPASCFLLLAFSSWRHPRRLCLYHSLESTMTSSYPHSSSGLDVMVDMASDVKHDVLA